MAANDKSVLSRTDTMQKSRKPTISGDGHARRGERGRPLSNVRDAAAFHALRDLSRHRPMVCLQVQDVRRHRQDARLSKLLLSSWLGTAGLAY